MKSIGKKSSTGKSVVQNEDEIKANKKAAKLVAAAKKVAEAEHLEIERKYRISEKESRSIETKLERRDFIWEVTSVITDTLLPAPSGETHRIRREQILDGAAPVVVFFDTRKTHPVMPDGQHVRQEKEETIDAQSAEQRLADAMHAACSTLPSYSKTRRTYAGKYTSKRKTYDVKVAMDCAQGLCRYSGNYFEIEVLLPLASLKNVKTVKKVQQAIESFARELLGENRRATMSYRKMLLASISGPSVVS